MGYPEVTLPRGEKGARQQGWPGPIWQVLLWSLPVLSEITGDSLFWVKLFGGLISKIDREPGRVE